MPVSRISERALRRLLKEPIEQDALCVIKFYSNGCDYCTALHEYYVDIADSHEENNIHFFAFNVDDVENLESIIKINGVPSIASVKTGLIKPRVRVLEDPDPPNKNTWFYSTDIKNFIERETK
jgi:thiol-disulfide isomerase/thioredoxin